MRILKLFSEIFSNIYVIEKSSVKVARVVNLK